MCGLHAGTLNVGVLPSGVVDPSEKQTKAKDTLPEQCMGQACTVLSLASVLLSTS